MLLKGESGEGKGLGNAMRQYNIYLICSLRRKETMERYDECTLPTGPTQRTASYHASPVRPPSGR